MKTKTYAEIQQEKKNKLNKAEDLLIENSLAKPGEYVIYKQSLMLKVKHVYLENNEIVYLCKGKSKYYLIHEYEMNDYLMGCGSLNEPGFRATQTPYILLEPPRGLSIIDITKLARSLS